MKFLYLAVNLASVIIPLIFSFHPKLNFNKKFRFALPAILLTAVIFILWDFRFTALGVWGFNDKYITGLRIINLPVEEVMFFICIPFACLFTYYSLNRLYRFRLPDPVARITVLILSLILLATGFLFRDQRYTAYTFFSTAILLLAITFVRKAEWMGNFLVAYLILLIPFLIVNGILTGTGPAEPVVWYNNRENMDVRILTIPVEDFIYGLEMILLNVFFYEWFNRGRLRPAGDPRIR